MITNPLFSLILVIFFGVDLLFDNGKPQKDNKILSQKSVEN